MRTITLTLEPELAERLEQLSRRDLRRPRDEARVAFLRGLVALESEPPPVPSGPFGQRLGRARE